MSWIFGFNKDNLLLNYMYTNHTVHSQLHFMSVQDVNSTVGYGVPLAIQLLEAWSGQKWSEQTHLSSLEMRQYNSFKANAKTLTNLTFTHFCITRSLQMLEIEELTVKPVNSACALSGKQPQISKQSYPGFSDDEQFIHLWKIKAMTSSFPTVMLWTYAGEG